MTTAVSDLTDEQLREELRRLDATSPPAAATAPAPPPTDLSGISTADLQAELQSLGVPPAPTVPQTMPDGTPAPAITPGPGLPITPPRAAPPVKAETRLDGTLKGPGFFGTLARPDGRVSTELSIGVELDGKEIQIPLIVPTLTKVELDHLLSGEPPTPEIRAKAVAHARPRIAEGKSPFAAEGDQVAAPFTPPGTVPPTALRPVTPTLQFEAERQKLLRQGVRLEGELTLAEQAIEERQRDREAGILERAQRTGLPVEQIRQDVEKEERVDRLIAESLQTGFDPLREEAAREQREIFAAMGLEEGKTPAFVEDMFREAGFTGQEDFLKSATKRHEKLPNRDRFLIEQGIRGITNDLIGTVSESGPATILNFVNALAAAAAVQAPETLAGVGRGLELVPSSVFSIQGTYFRAIGEKVSRDVLPVTWRETIEGAENAKLLDGRAEPLLGVAVMLGQQLPRTGAAIALSAAPGLAAPAVTALLGNGMAFGFLALEEAGNFDRRAEAIGIDRDIRQKYGLLYGGISGMIENFQIGGFRRAYRSTGGNPGLLKKLVSELLEITKQGAEEVAQGITEDDFIDRAIREHNERHPDNPITDTAVVESMRDRFISGVVVGAFLRAPGSVTTAFKAGPGANLSKLPIREQLAALAAIEQQILNSGRPASSELRQQIFDTKEKIKAVDEVDAKGQKPTEAEDKALNESWVALQKTDAAQSAAQAREDANLAVPEGLTPEEVVKAVKPTEVTEPTLELPVLQTFTGEGAGARAEAWVKSQNITNYFVLTRGEGKKAKAEVHAPKTIPAEAPEAPVTPVEPPTVAPEAPVAPPAEITPPEAAVTPEVAPEAVPAAPEAVPEAVTPTKAPEAPKPAKPAVELIPPIKQKRVQPPKVQERAALRKRLSDDVKTANAAFKAGKQSLFEAQNDIRDAISELNPFTANRLLNKLVKAQTPAQLEKVAGEVSGALLKESIPGTKERAAKEKIVISPRDLLRQTLKLTGTKSFKAALQSGKDLVKIHTDLAQFAKDTVSKKAQARLLPMIARARTLGQRRAVAASIEAIGQREVRDAGWRELKETVRTAKREDLRPEFAKKMDALLDSFAISQPTAKTISRASSLLAAVERDDLGEIPKRLIDGAIVKLAAVDKLKLRKMPVESIRHITAAIKNVLHLNATKNQLLASRKFKEIAKARDAAVSEVEARHGKKFTADKPTRIDRLVTGPVVDVTILKQLSHDTNVHNTFDDFGAGREILFDNLKDAQNQFQTLTDDAQAYAQGALADNNLDAKKLQVWSTAMDGSFKAKIKRVPGTNNLKKGNTVLLPHKLESGKTVWLSKGERTELLAHFLDGDTRAEIIRGDGIGLESQTQTDAPSFELTAVDVAAIENSATAEEKNVAVQLRNYLNSDAHLRGRLNEAWVKEHGYEIARRKDYFPRRRDRKTIKDPNASLQKFHQRYLDQQGIFKLRAPTTDPIIIGDIFATWFKHVNQANSFIAKGAVTNDAIRLLNDPQVKNAVRAGMRHGNTILREMEASVRDFAGVDVQEQNSIDKITRGLIRKAQVGALGLKPHIAAYQMISLANATNEISAKFVFNPKNFSPIGVLADIAEMKKHSPQMKTRLEGSAHRIITPDSGGIAVQGFYGAKEESLVSRIGMKPIHLSDTAVMVALWRAAKREQKGNLQATARRMEQIVDRTQPTWWTLTTSGLLRYGKLQPLFKLMVMFSSQRNKNFNMMARALSDFVAAGNKEGGRTAKDYRTLARKLAVPSIVNAVGLVAISTATSLAGAALFGGEEDEETGLDLANAFLSRVFGNWLIVGDALAELTTAQKNVVQGKNPFLISKRRNILVQSLQNFIQASVFSTAAAMDAFEDGELSLSDLGQDTKSGRKALRAGENALRASSMIMGIPIQGLIKPIKQMAGLQKKKKIKRRSRQRSR